MRLSNKHIVHCGRCNPGCDEWNYSDSQLQEMIAPFCYFKSADIDNEVTVKFILWDANGNMQDGTNGETALLKYCSQYNPSMVFVNAQGVPSMFDNGLTVDMLRFRGIKVVFQWGDSVEIGLKHRIRNIAEKADLTILVDDPLFEQEIPDKLVWMWSFPPISPSPVKPAKDIDVSFAGNVLRYPDRLRYIQFVKDNNIPLFLCGGDSGFATVGDVFNRSKISLNFSLVNQGTKHQLKSRTIEAPAAFSLLMESENPLISLMYEPFEEYIPFTNEQDLVDKIRYYLKNDSEREEITDRAFKKLVNNYTPQQWWKKVFDRLGI